MYVCPAYSGGTQTEGKTSWSPKSRSAIPPRSNVQPRWGNNSMLSVLMPASLHRKVAHHIDVPLVPICQRPNDYQVSGQRTASSLKKKTQAWKYYTGTSKKKYVCMHVYTQINFILGKRDGKPSVEKLHNVGKVSILFNTKSEKWILATHGNLAYNILCIIPPKYFRWRHLSL